MRDTAYGKLQTRDLNNSSWSMNTKLLRFVYNTVGLVAYIAATSLLQKQSHFNKESSDVTRVEYHPLIRFFHRKTLTFISFSVIKSTGAIGGEWSDFFAAFGGP